MKKVFLISRNLNKYQKWKCAKNHKVLSWKKIRNINVDLLINATPIGMFGQSNEPSIITNKKNFFLKYIYDLLPILYNRSIIYFKVLNHFKNKFFNKPLYSKSKGIIPGKNYKKTESNLTYIVIQSEREDILFALNEYKIKGGETIVPDGKEDVYNLVNEYLYKDITFSESLFSSISDYEKELNDHTFTGMVKIGFEESKDQIFSNTLSYGLTNLIQSLIATFSFLIIY